MCARKWRAYWGRVRRQRTREPEAEPHVPEAEPPPQQCEQQPEVQKRSHHAAKVPQLRAPLDLMYERLSGVDAQHAHVAVCRARWERLR